MENLSLRELVTAVQGRFIIGDPHSKVRNVSIDTRTMYRGDCYFAIKGRNFDGHDFIKQALDKGVSALVISRQDVDLGNPFPAMPAVIYVEDTFKALGELARYYRKKWDIPFVGITGSNGKTTTKEMLASILSQKGPVLKTEGNFNNQVGLPMTLFRASSEHKYAAIEMGTSVKGEIERLAGIVAPSIGIITNIGSAHLENFIDKDGVLAEKRALFDSLSPGGCAVVNVDDPYIFKVAPSLKCEIITTGIEGNAMVRAEKIELWPDKPKFELVIKDENIPVALPVYGRFNISNALAAAAAAWKLGFSIAHIKKGLENFTPAGMRMETVGLVSDVTVVNDAYNANPSSMREALASLVQSFPDRDKIVVLADMLELGASSETEHAELGKFLASQPIAKVFLYGPAMEKAMGSLSQAQARHFVNREKLEFELKLSLAPGSVVFFKGSRGMRLEETIKKLFPDS